MAETPTPAVLFDQALSRAAGATLVRGNRVLLLKDARENYAAWLQAIQQARQHIHFECYIIHADEVGRRFAEAFIAKAREGVPVRLVYDWVGALGAASPGFWRALRDGGVEVRCFNPPRFDEPMGWVRRNHRKSLVVDGRVAFVSGLCIGKMWEGWPERRLPGWRDTGVELRGPAVADVARAFADTWAATGEPLSEADLPAPGSLPEEGDSPVRVVATTSGSGSVFRLDTLIAALSRRTLWLTDAYYAGTSAYVQALRAAAGDGVDVRLLVPGRGSDLRLVQSISRAGYRPLLESGIRVFEWNGPMLHAKSAVADVHWSRVGSTNLNIASWLGNWEMDVVVEDAAFGRQMEQMYLDDLSHATEVVLTRRRRVLPAGEATISRTRGTGGSASRAAAGAVRIGNAIGSALGARRLLGRAEVRLLIEAGLILLAVAGLAFLFPRVVAVPVGALALWMGLALLVRAARTKRRASDSPEARLEARRRAAAVAPRSSPGASP